MAEGGSWGHALGIARNDRSIRYPDAVGVETESPLPKALVFTVVPGAYKCLLRGNLEKATIRTPWSEAIAVRVPIPRDVEVNLFTEDGVNGHHRGTGWTVGKLRVGPLEGAKEFSYLEFCPRTDEDIQGAIHAIQRIGSAFAEIAEAQVAVPRLSESEWRMIIDHRVRAWREVVERPGQGRFRDELMEAYGGRCAVTDCAVEAVLEAAHLYPYMGDKSDVVPNGLLLRSDIHTMLDSRLLRIHPESLAIELDHSTREYEQLIRSSHQLRLPASATDRPSNAGLRWRYQSR